MPAKKTSPAPSKRKTKSTKSTSGKSDAALAVVAGVKITHPNRVVYADAGVTKLDLARYCEQVADWILRM